MLTPTLRFDPVRKVQTGQGSEDCTTMPCSPHHGEDFTPPLTEFGLELCEIVNEIPEDQLDSMLKTLPKVNMEWVKSFPGVMRLMEMKGTGQQTLTIMNGKAVKRKRTGSALTQLPLKTPKVDSASTVPRPAADSTPKSKPDQSLYAIIEARRQKALAEASLTSTQKQHTVTKRETHKAEDLYSSLGLLGRK